PPHVAPRFERTALVDHAAVTALPLLEVQDRIEEMALAEVGPESGRDPDLAVRDLPEKEVGYAHLAAGADEQIRIRKPRGRKAGAQRLVVDLLRREPAAGDVVGEGAAGV